MNALATVNVIATSRWRFAAPLFWFPACLMLVRNSYDVRWENFVRSGIMGGLRLGPVWLSLPLPPPLSFSFFFSYSYQSICLSVCLPICLCRPRTVCLKQCFKPVCLLSMMSGWNSICHQYARPESEFSLGVWPILPLVFHSIYVLLSYFTFSRLKENP